MDKLRDTLDRFGIRADKRFGQNFLSDTNLLEAIVKDAGVTKEDIVLEIGAGTGALTVPLSNAAKKVVAIEIDRRLEPPLREIASNHNNIDIIFGDVLKIDVNEINSLIGGRFKLVANLPYYITSPLLFYFLENDFLLDSLTVMVQKEVAERMTAAHNTQGYGALTAAIKLHGDAQITRIVPRQMFFPAPDVDSAIVKIVLSDKYKEGKKKALRLIRCAFSMRRKTLINNITKDYGKTKEECERILSQLSIDPKARGESLTPHQLYTIGQML